MTSQIGVHMGSENDEDPSIATTHHGERIMKLTPTCHTREVETSVEGTVTIERILHTLNYETEEGHKLFIKTVEITHDGYSQAATWRAEFRGHRIHPSLAFQMLAASVGE